MESKTPPEKKLSDTSQELSTSVDPGLLRSDFVSVDVEKLSSHTICGVCSKPYNDPRILPCLHSFCLQCLHHEIEKSDSQQVLKCTICDKHVTIPEGGVNTLPQNLHLTFEVEVAGCVLKIMNQREIKCDHCIDGSNGPAVVFCCTCHEFLCKVAYEYHRSGHQLSKHVMVGLDQEGARQLQTMMKPKDCYCSQPNHEGSKMGFYCETCSQMVCPYCTTVTHKNHNVSELSTVAKIHQMEIRESLEKVKEVITKLTEAIDGKNRMIEEAEISKRNALLAIEEAFGMLQQSLLQRKMELLSELEAISLSRITDLTLEKERLERIGEDIGHYTKVASHIMGSYTEHEIVALERLIPTELQAILRSTQTTFVAQIVIYDNMHVFMQTDELVREISKFGQVFMYCHSPSSSSWKSTGVAKVGSKYIVELESKNSKGEEFHYGDAEVKGEMKSKTHNEAVVYGEVEDHRNGTYTITFIPETSGPHQVLITMDGHHVQNSPHDIDVRPKRDYQSLCNLLHVIKCNSNPRGIAIHDSGDIYVGTNAGCIDVFDERGELKNSIGSKGSGDGQFNYPTGIFIKADVLYVADRDNNRIQKLTSKGEFLHKFGEKGSGPGQFSGPRAIVMDSSNRLNISDWENHRIQIFTENGCCLLTIDGNGSGDHSFKNPWGLALDQEGNIHVTAPDSNTIKVFTKEGTYIRMYGDLKGPMGIAINEECYTFVNERDGNCLSVYDPKGKKVHTVENLNNPLGIGLNCRGDSVFIADFSSGTLLKYCL